MTRNDTQSDDPLRGRRTFLKTVGGLAAFAAAGTGAAAAKTSGFSKTDVEIESFDGTTLAATLYEPAGNDRQPAMLMTHGYGGSRADVEPWATMYAASGYVTLTYDSRGFGESGGEVNVDGPKEVKDAQTLITWLADDENVRVKKDGPNNPKIGMDGLSYAGGIQLNTAAAEGRGEGIPESGDRIDAIVPRWAWHDLTYSLAPNGVIKSGWETFLLAAGAGGSHLTGDDAEDYVRGQSPELYRYAVESAAQNELTDEAREYFKSRSPVQDIEDITAPALFVQGWPDTLFVPNEAIWNGEGMGTEHRFVFFEGGHTLTDMAGPEQKAFIDRLALDWIDTHVRHGGATDLPPVTYYEVQTGEWNTADGIAPSNATPRTLNLADVSEGDSTPVFNSVIPTSTSQLVPINADTAVTSIDFDFVVEEATEILGAPQLALQVEPLGPEARLFTKFSHVHNGEETLINNQVTPLTVEGEPGSVETVEVEIVAFQRRLKPGDILRFVVATTDAGFLSSRTSAGAYIHHSDEYPSTVAVPAIGGKFADSNASAETGEFVFDISE